MTHDRKLLATLFAATLAWALTGAQPAAAAFVDHGDGTVTDTATGLMWDKCSWGQAGNTCTGTASSKVWAAALGTAVSANVTAYKGYTDWRLPNRVELESLVDIASTVAAIDLNVFPNTQMLYYWTSTVYVPTPADAWDVHFGIGLTTSHHRSNPMYLRLVRSGAIAGAFDALDNFAFLAQTNVPPGTVATSNTITVEGAGAAAPIAITGGSYSINGDPYTNASGTVGDGDTVSARQVASADLGTTTTAVVQIGGLTDKVFAVTTLPGGILTVTRGGTGAGTVASDLPGIDCGADCIESYTAAAPVTLTANPAPGSAFMGWLGACTGTGPCVVSVAGATGVAATFAPDTVTPHVDVDGNTGYDALTDGLLVLRYLFGLTGTALTNGAIGINAARATPDAVFDYMENIRPLLDIDGNGRADALTDGLMLIRYLFGLRGPSVIAGAVGPGATRMDADQIEPYIASIL